MREEISVLLAKAEAQQRMYSRGRPSNQVVDALVEMLQRVKYGLTAQDKRIAELEKERDEANCHAYYILDTCTVFSPKKLEAHNLEQQAKGVDDFADAHLMGIALEDSIKYCDSLHCQIKALKEQGE